MESTKKKRSDSKAAKSKPKSKAPKVKKEKEESEDITGFQNDQLNMSKDDDIPSVPEQQPTTKNYQLEDVKEIEKKMELKI